MKHTDEKLAEIFLEEAVKYEKFKQWAIPNELQTIFLNLEGYYPFFLAVKDILKRLESEK